MLIMQKHGATTPAAPDARRRVYFRLVNGADGLGPVTGATVTVAVHKNGFAATTGGTVGEVGGGLYYYVAAPGDLSDLGSLLVTPSAPNAITATYEVMVVDYDPVTAPASTDDVASAVAVQFSTRLGS